MLECPVLPRSSRLCFQSRAVKSPRGISMPRTIYCYAGRNGNGIHRLYAIEAWIAPHGSFVSCSAEAKKALARKRPALPSFCWMSIPTGCAAAVPRLMGGMPPEQPERYALSSPSDLLPIGVPTRMVHGSLDTTVPLEQSRAFARKAFAAGDDAQVIVLEHSAHFDPVAPTSADWPSVLGAIRAMSRGF